MADDNNVVVQLSSG
jgi:hypothetical protein